MRAGHLSSPRTHVPPKSPSRTSASCIYPNTNHLSGGGEEQVSGDKCQMTRGISAKDTVLRGNLTVDAERLSWTVT